MLSRTHGSIRLAMGCDPALGQQPLFRLVPSHNISCSDMWHVSMCLPCGLRSAGRKAGPVKRWSYPTKMDMDGKLYGCTQVALSSVWPYFPAHSLSVSTDHSIAFGRIIYRLASGTARIACTPFARAPGECLAARSTKARAAADNIHHHSHRINQHKSAVFITRPVQQTAKSTSPVTQWLMTALYCAVLTVALLPLANESPVRGESSIWAAAVRRPHQTVGGAPLVSETPGGIGNKTAVRLSAVGARSRRSRSAASAALTRGTRTAPSVRPGCPTTPLRTTPLPNPAPYPSRPL